MLSDFISILTYFNNILTYKGNCTERGPASSPRAPASRNLVIYIYIFFFAVHGQLAMPTSQLLKLNQGGH